MLSFNVTRLRDPLKMVPCIFQRRRSFHQDFEVYSTHSRIVLVMLDILCPQLALNVDQNSGGQIPKLDPHQRPWRRRRICNLFPTWWSRPDHSPEIVFLVQKREEGALKSLEGGVVKWPDVLLVCGRLSVTRHPNHPKSGAVGFHVHALALAVLRPGSSWPSVQTNNNICNQVTF